MIVQPDDFSKFFSLCQYLTQPDQKAGAAEQIQSLDLSGLREIAAQTLLRPQLGSDQRELLLTGLKLRLETPKTKGVAKVWERVTGKEQAIKEETSVLRLLIDCLDPKADRIRLLDQISLRYEKGTLDAMDTSTLQAIVIRLAQLSGPGSILHHCYRLLANRIEDPEERKLLLEQASSKTPASPAFDSALKRQLHGGSKSRVEHLEALDSNLVSNNRLAIHHEVDRHGDLSTLVVRMQLTPKGVQLLRTGAELLTRVGEITVDQGNLTYHDRPGDNIFGTNATLYSFPYVANVYLANDPDQTALTGELKIVLHNPDPKTAAAELNKMMTLLGVGGIFSDQHTADSERAKRMSLFQILYPGQAEKLKHQPDVLALAPDALQAHMIKLVPALKNRFNDELAKMYLQEVRPGQHEWAYRGMEQRMRDAGAMGLMCGVGQLKTVVWMLKSGAKASLDRFADGSIIMGVSTHEDIRTGGARYVFTRVIKTSMQTTPIKYFPLYGSVQILYDLQVAERVCYMYSTDKYGDKRGEDYSKRSDVATVVEKLPAEATENELMLKGRIPPSKIRRLVVQDTATKDALINELYAHQLVDSQNRINGVPIEEFIVTATKFTSTMWERPQEFQEKEEGGKSWAPATSAEIAETTTPKVVLGKRKRSEKAFTETFEANGADLPNSPVGAIAIEKADSGEHKGLMRILIKSPTGIYERWIRPTKKPGVFRIQSSDGSFAGLREVKVTPGKALKEIVEIYWTHLTDTGTLSKDTPKTRARAV